MHKPKVRLSWTELVETMRDDQKDLLYDLIDQTAEDMVEELRRIQRTGHALHL